MNIRFKPCLAKSCQNNADRTANGKRGYCNKHYLRVLRFGDPDICNPVPSPAMDWIRDHMTFESDECLTWPFHIGRDGYGRAHDPIDGHLTTASRLICINAHGNPPGPNYECAHRCGKGNKGCVNPRHLYWATCATNHADKIEHGTTNRGERQGSHKLTEANIVAIRNSTESIATIAKRFDVTEGHIYDIRAGRRWEWFRT